MPMIRAKKGGRRIKIDKPITRFLVSDAALLKKVVDVSSSTDAAYSGPGREMGTGSPMDPYYLPLRVTPNSSGCFHCIEEKCHCVFFENQLNETFELLHLKRIVEVSGARQLCAKSLLPCFVSRLVRLMGITEKDTFYDFGCGNGSILFQVACLTGAKCIGIEISDHNAEVARSAWKTLKPSLEKIFCRPMPTVEVITGDLGVLLSDETYFDNCNGNEAILISNLLFPKPLSHYLSERLRRSPRGTRIMCFDDLYPHSRSIALRRDPEAFELFDMKDYRWQELSVEWCTMEGQFYIHTRK